MPARYLHAIRRLTNPAAAAAASSPRSSPSSSPPSSSSLSSRLHSSQSSSSWPPSPTGRIAGATDSRPTDPEAQALATWIIEARGERTTTGNPSRIWQLYQTGNFAALWYAARDAGERLRQDALRQLYTRRPIPGGAHPDPRKPAAFSSRAVLHTAASVLGVTIWPAPEAHAASADLTGAERLSPASGSSPYKPQLAWIVTYPHLQRPPDIAVRVTTRLAAELSQRNGRTP